MNSACRKLLALSWLLTFLAGPAVQLLRAGDESTVPAGTMAAQSDSAQQTDKKGGRLPNYYGKVVTNEQRTQIYAIQEEYAPQIKQLQDTLRALTDKRDAAVSAVLTTDQRQLVEKMKTEAQAKRKQKASAAKEDASKSAAVTPPATSGQ